MHEIELTFDEGMSAAMVGAVQMMRATRNGWVDSDHGGKSGRDLRERWAQSIHGAMAECALCKYLGRFWGAGVDGICGSDAYGIEVRSTPWDSGKLIICQKDIETHPGHPFVLVTGHWPRFTVRGWLLAHNAQNESWYRADERPPSYWVPQECLKTMESLPR